MTPQTRTLLQSARIAELGARSNELAALVRPAPAVAIGDSSSRLGRRRLLLLLAHERRRNKRLAAELTNGV